MDVGTVYREPREFLSPWPNPDILVLELLGDTHLGGGETPLFFLVLLNLEGRVCTWKAGISLPCKASPQEHRHWASSGVTTPEGYG